MSKVKKAQQNLTLPIDIIDCLRNLSDYRKRRGVEPAAMADIVTLCLKRYFEENKQEVGEANFRAKKIEGRDNGLPISFVYPLLPDNVRRSLAKLVGTGAKITTLNDLNGHNIKNIMKLVTMQELGEIHDSVLQMQAELIEIATPDATGGITLTNELFRKLAEKVGKEEFKDLVVVDDE